MYDAILRSSDRELEPSERFQAISFLRAHIGLSLKPAVDLLRELQAGGEKRLEAHEPFDVPSPLIVTFQKQPDPHEVFFAKQQELRKLCERGANGDAEAAMAYCRAEINYEVSHGACG